MALITSLLASRADTRPDAAAFRVGRDGRSISWRRLAAHADRWQQLTALRDLPPRARIGLMIGDPLCFVAAYLGCLAAGLTAVPLDPRLTTTELRTSVTRMKIDVLATDHTDLLDCGGVEVWLAGDKEPSVVSPAGYHVHPSHEAALRPAVLLSSSGTTGAPKGIPLSEQQLVEAAARVVEHHRLGPADIGYSPLPLFHVNAQVIGVMATLVGGGSLVVDQRFDADTYWDTVAAWLPTWLNAVPAMLAKLAERPAPPDDVSARARFARSASAPLAPATLHAFEARSGISVLETYGMSEVAGQVTANPLEVNRRRPGSVGLPVGLSLAVANGDEPAARGHEGMIRLRGDAVISHYLELTDEGPERCRPARSPDGWLTTGDVGFLDEDGFVHLVGRADDVINRGGEKIHPLDVENVLLAHPEVRAAAVVGEPHTRLGQVPVAFVTVAPSADESIVDALGEFVEQRLTRYKRPARIEIARSLPLGPTGKVLRRALRADLEASSGR